MVVFCGEEVAHHFNLDFPSGFEDGSKIGLGIHASEQVGVIDAAAILLANIVTLLIHGVGVDETEEVLKQLR